MFSESFPNAQHRRHTRLKFRDYLKCLAASAKTFNIVLKSGRPDFSSFSLSLAPSLLAKSPTSKEIERIVGIDPVIPTRTTPVTGRDCLNAASEKIKHQTVIKKVA